MTQENKNTNSILKDAKKYVNKNNLFAFGAYALSLLLVLVASIPDIIISPERVFTMDFLTKELIAIIITIVSMTCFVFIGRNNNQMQPLSEYNIARGEFKKTRDIIQNDDNLFSGFEQWIENKFEEQEQKRKDKRLLKSKGIKDFSYLDLDYNELNELKEHSIKKDNHYYKQINEEQYKMLIAILNGKTRIGFIKWTDYLSDRTYGEELEISEILSNENRATVRFMATSIISKVVMGVLIASIFASITIDLSKSDSMTQEEVVWTTIINLLQRLFNATWSAFLGNRTGKELNDRSAVYLNYKSTVHKMYLKDKDFKPLSEQELARQDYLKHEREKNKQANEQYAKEIGLRNEDNEKHNEIIAL